ncbi:MAG TPA: ABC transporter permease [Cyclobacteriaceae bacterium]|nr:ABC transporter permease [Cyclobacteriaceae bacterium]
MNHQPPKWADRLLQWYCNPDLLEEIQGDAHELYFERIKKEGKRLADLKYLWDILRFFRWSNIKRTQPHHSQSRALWNFNFKIAFRNASRNKVIFSVKALGLSFCLAFVLLLTAFAVNELTYDHFHKKHNRIFRITSKVTFQDQVTHYAVTPLPIGQALVDGIPEVENYLRFMFEDKPIFRVNEETYHNEVTLAADSNFLKILTFEFLQGESNALSGPDKIVLTKSAATKFFGEEDPMGRTVEYGDGKLLEVSAVIKDVPVNSHLRFDALVSWETIERWDDWGNLNAYTYILLKQSSSIDDIKTKMAPVLSTFHELVAREYNATFEPIFQNITDIHYAEVLDEDIVVTSSKSNLFILLAIIVLFFVTGVINYLNLTLAELAANLKRIGILKVFGGLDGNHNRIIFTDALFTLLIVSPLALLIGYLGWRLSDTYLSIHFDRNVLTHPLFIGTTIGFVSLLLASSKLNGFLLSRISHVVNLLKGKISAKQHGISLRKILVGAQLSFSVIMIALIFVIVDQFYFIREADKGFDDKNTVVVKLRARNNSQVQTFNDALRKLTNVAKVEGSSYYPGIIETKYVFRVETEQGMEQLLVPMMICGHDYFETLNIKMSQGRGFEKNHTEDLYGSFVINETAAREFGWEDPLGKKIDGPVTGQDEAYHNGEVIGVVRDFNFATLHSKIEPMIIFLADDNWVAQFIYIKTNPIHSPDLIPSIENIYKTQWPEQPFEWEYLDSKYLSLYEKDYEMKNIFEIGLIISVVISCLGIFSISALLVSLRTKEMGIRKVVGANAAQIFMLHAKSFLQFLIISMVVACPAIWFLSEQWLQNFAYHIELTIGYFIIPGACALIITIITSGYHGVKGALVSPADILKYE